MSRGLTASMQAEIVKSTLRPAFFAMFDFVSGPVRFWSGSGDKVWNSNTYYGTGVFGTVSNVQENKQSATAHGIKFSLSGVPGDVVSLALTENYRGRFCYLWMGFLTSANAIIADPTQLFAGRMDLMTITDTSDSAAVTISAESRLIDLQRARERRYTHEDQIQLYPDDLGLNFVAGLQDKEVVWGGQASGSSSTQGNPSGSNRAVNGRIPV